MRLQPTSGQHTKHLEEESKTMNKLLSKYYELLQKAESTTNRSDEIRIIRESTKVKEELAEYSGLR